MDQVKAAFKQFLSAANSPHGLDAYTKQAMAIALSVAMRCEPCLKMHLKTAQKKGFTQAEIDEADEISSQIAAARDAAIAKMVAGQKSGS